MVRLKFPRSHLLTYLKLLTTFPLSSVLPVPSQQLNFIPQKDGLGGCDGSVSLPMKKSMSYNNNLLGLKPGSGAAHPW
jgi:hypothetical protein